MRPAVKLRLKPPSVPLDWRWLRFTADSVGLAPLRGARHLLTRGESGFIRYCVGVRRCLVSFAILWGALAATAPDPLVRAQGQTRPEPAPPQRHSRLYAPIDLGLLEAPDRAAWQKPDEIMDALHVAEGSKVADIGAGAGWFTIRLARRVGPNGKVFAEDVQRLMIEAVKRRVDREGLRNVETRLGSESDPNLPRATLDAVLMVDSYHEVDVDLRVALLRSFAKTLKPQGLIGIVNWKPGRGGPGPDEDVPRVGSETLEADARKAGLKVRSRLDLPYQYLLVLAP
jgi:SAM-dependent methyltransferase